VSSIIIQHQKSF